MLKSRTGRAFAALAVLMFSSVQISTIADAKDKRTGSGNGSAVHTIPGGNVGSGQVTSRKSLAERRAACHRRAFNDWFDDKRECNRHQESRTGQGRRECEAVAYLAYQMQRDKCARMQ